MGVIKKSFYPILSVIACLCLVIGAFYLIHDFLNGTPSTATPKVDFVNIAIILLTTVTVVFSVSALVLAVLGVIGFKNLQRKAETFAAERTILEIGKSFEENGLATKRIEQEFQDEGSYLQRLVERRVRSEVIELLPLALSSTIINGDEGRMAVGEPTDEGDVE